MILSFYSNNLNNRALRIIFIQIKIKPKFFWWNVESFRKTSFHFGGDRVSWKGPNFALLVSIKIDKKSRKYCCFIMLWHFQGILFYCSELKRVNDKYSNFLQEHLLVDINDLAELSVFQINSHFYKKETVTVNNI